MNGDTIDEEEEKINEQPCMSSSVVVEEHGRARTTAVQKKFLSLEK